MRSNSYSSTNPENGNVTWEGPLSLEKGNHDHMPSRTDAYLPGDERGHVNASSLGGNNTTDNIVPQNADVNHGGYYSMEQGERTALKNGATIDSTKTAIVDGRPGDRPNAFLVNDSVTYSDGHTEIVSNSFTNESYADQQAWNDLSASLPDTFDAPNPGDGLRDSMSTEEYADLMESTDAYLPDIADDYAPSDSSGLPGSDDVSADDDADASTDTGASSGDDGGADCSSDDD